MNLISLTKLYDLLVIKFGRETAGHLTEYIEDKINYVFLGRSQLLATKEDLTTVKDNLSKEISSVKDNLTKEISSVKDNLTKEISSVKDNLTKEISRLDIRIGETKSELIKWMFVFWVAQAASTFGFILLFSKK